MLLAIDTSTQLAGLALFDGQVRAELTWQAGRNHSSQLLTQIERLNQLLGSDLESLSAIGVARGPGSFTGLRVGLAVAQGLALALGVPAYGVCSLDVLAAAQELTGLPIRPLLEAGRGRFATASYHWVGANLQCDGEIAGIRLEQLAELVERPTVLCGDLDAAARERIRGILGERAVLASPATSLRRPAVLAQLAWQHREQPADPTELEPLYLAR